MGFPLQIPPNVDQLKNQIRFKVTDLQGMGFPLQLSPNVDQLENTIRFQVIELRLPVCSICSRAMEEALTALDENGWGRKGEYESAGV
ncbi:hypothetical protein L1987_32685 [Smallanthus sonchifolius]|uniref:Uncharacterized protein n=1 Tax=Smallanthus sonchifolius TaxID=185202 RepID=A0ACB9HPS7_9ASTR|nr:hypothetical protein L1987_32685 [Smallanthus sonchifolius]